MEGLRWAQLTPDERNDFLGTGGTGVLSFATEPERSPASFPVSYGYLADDESIYFRLSFPPGSSKENLIGNPVTFVTYDETDHGWRSVIATGSLEELAELPHESAAVQGMWGVEIPVVDVFDRPREEIEFQDFRLVLDRLTGRKESR